MTDRMFGGFLLGVALLIAFLFLLLYLDGREFAADCLKAGGTVISPKVCLP